MASHDPTLVEIAQAMARDVGRAEDSWEVQMLLGVRPEEQTRLAGEVEALSALVHRMARELGVEPE